MSPKLILFVASLFLLRLSASAQYTEKINSNRPGGSQGAFAVGNNVLQGEGGFTYGKQKHELLKTKSSVFYVDYALRYGLLMERLEINIIGRFRTEGIKQTIGVNEEKIRKTDFQYNTIGAKYLIYDPYKRPKENDSLDLVKRKSWKEHYKFRLSNLIPAVSAYVGMNYVNTDNAFTFENDLTLSPKFVIMTQNNWWTSKAGSWVLVTNFIVDKITTDTPAFGWFITSTHTINDKWAVFGEYQGQKSNFYSDDLLRLGGAYLFDKNFQIDANITTNFKDTPSIFTVSVGASYRFDWHTRDELILPPGLKRGIKKQQKESQEDEENEDNLGEFEEIENDSLKQERTSFINPFEEDSSIRDAMEQDLDERRTASRIERERLEQEKIDKKNAKKFAKEERRRIKREAKEAKLAEKARIKAEKEKQKMIEDIDAELNKIEEDDGTGSMEDELNKLEEELKKLDNPESPPQNESIEQDDGPGNDAIDIEQDNQEAAKFEEKRRKKEEKRKLKEEKKRKKEEEKRKKAEEKQKKLNEDIDNELDEIDGF